MAASCQGWFILRVPACGMIIIIMILDGIMDEYLLIYVLMVGVFITISSADDAFFDIVAFGIERFSFPRPIGATKIPATAVFVANWHEENVLERMVEGNLSRIPIPSVKLYLGVYPNDTGTRDVALRLAEKYPDRVCVIKYFARSDLKRSDAK